MSRRREQSRTGWWTRRSGRLIRPGALLLLAVATACSGDDDAESSAADDSVDTTVADGTTTTDASSLRDEIADRYRAYWEARFAANSPPNPDDPALREYATGEQLDQVVRETETNLAEGLEYRRAEDPVDFQRVDVISVDGDTAVVQECYVADGTVVRSSDGTVVDDSVTTHNVRGEMRRVDGEWRLASTTLVQQWDGVAGCALAD